MSMEYYIWTDGGCRPNPGYGGWGVFIRSDYDERSLYGGETHSTNNRMELTAAVRALHEVPNGSRVILYTDSQYVRNGIMRWMVQWERRNWKTSDGKPVANVDLWKDLAHAAHTHDIDWRWVKGHSGVRENEIVDELATRGLMEAKSGRR